MNPQQRNYLLSAVILAILVVGLMSYYSFMVAQPKMEKLDAAIKKEVSAKRELQKKIREYENFLMRQSEIEATIETIALATERLPSGPDDERYLELITDFISKTGVSMTTMRYDKNRAYPSYIELPNLVEGANTRYNDLVQFLSLAEQNVTLFMRVAEFNIQSDPQTPFLHPFDLQLSTFIFAD